MQNMKTKQQQFIRLKKNSKNPTEKKTLLAHIFTDNNFISIFSSLEPLM